MMQLGFEDWIWSSSSSTVLGCTHIFASGTFWESHEAVTTSEGPGVFNAAQTYHFLCVMGCGLRINWFTLLKSNCRMISTVVLEIELLLLITVEDTPPHHHPKLMQFWNPVKSGISVRIFPNSLKFLCRLRVKMQAMASWLPYFPVRFLTGCLV